VKWVIFFGVVGMFGVVVVVVLIFIIGLGSMVWLMLLFGVMMMVFMG